MSFSPLQAELNDEYLEGLELAETKAVQVSNGTAPPPEVTEVESKNREFRGDPRPKGAAYDDWFDANYSHVSICAAVSAVDSEVDIVKWLEYHRSIG